MFEWIRRLFMTTEEKLAEINKPIVLSKWTDKDGNVYIWDVNGTEYKYPVEDKDESK